MNYIINEFKIDDMKLSIEQNIMNNTYSFHISHLKTFTNIYNSGAFESLEQTRETAFKYFNIQH